jgi:hypothetical protein
MSENFRTDYDWKNVVDPITDDEAKEWVKNLRSGKYLQGEGDLRIEEYEYTSPNGKPYLRRYVKPHHCCLGVLQDQINVKVRECAMTLIGDELEGLKLPVDLQDELAGMNDGGTSFKKIATFIEKGFNLKE